MKPRFELGKFPDGRAKFQVRFFENSNFWIQGSEATWVPTLDEAEDLHEFLNAIDEYNKNKKAART